MKKLHLGLLIFCLLISCKSHKEHKTKESESVNIVTEKKSGSFLDSIFNYAKVLTTDSSSTTEIHLKQYEIEEDCPINEEIPLSLTANWSVELKHYKDRDSVVGIDSSNPTTQIKGVDFGHGNNHVTIYKNGKKRKIKGIDLTIFNHTNVKKNEEQKGQGQKIEVKNEQQKGDSTAVKTSETEDSKSTYPWWYKILLFGLFITTISLIIIFIKTKTNKQ